MRDNDNPFWEWPADACQQVRYLCWRAVGEDRLTSIGYSLRGVMPAPWAMLYPSEEV